MDHLIAGQRNPKVLAQLARAAARRKISQLEEALEGAEFFTPGARRPAGQGAGTHRPAVRRHRGPDRGDRRLARGRGTAKACVATGNTQLKVYHKLLSKPGMRYADLGPDYYDRQRDVRRQVAHHVGKLGSLG
jgi:hypothetical protein